MTTLKQSGYAHVSYNKDTGLHTLYNINTGEFERYTANKGYGGHTLPYKNTELEFCNSYSAAEKSVMINYMRRVQYWGEQHPEFTSTLLNVYRKYIAS